MGVAHMCRLGGIFLCSVDALGELCKQRRRRIAPVKRKCVSAKFVITPLVFERQLNRIAHQARKASSICFSSTSPPTSLPMTESIWNFPLL